MSGTVQEAREKAENAITRFGDRDASHDEWVLCVAALDAYAQSVRAEERARCVWIVKQSQEVFVPMSMRVGRNDERYIDATELLSRLTGGPHE